MRQQFFARSQRPRISAFMLALPLALAVFFTACSSGSESSNTSSGGTANDSAPTNTGTGTETSAPAASTSSGSASTAAVTATNPYDAAMQKLTQASSYHFIMTTDVQASADSPKPSHSVADGVYAKSNKAMQYKLESNAEYSTPGEWIDIGNGKQAFHKVDGTWTNKGFITPPGVGFSLQTLLTVVALRNATDPANNAPPTSLGSENIDGVDCDHYRVKMTEQTYDVYINKASGDVVRADFTTPKQKQTLSISHLNEPVNITAPPV